MPNLNPQRAKEEIRNLLENLLLYNAQKNSPLKPPLKLETRWHQTNLQVQTTLQSLLIPILKSS